MMFGYNGSPSLTGQMMQGQGQGQMMPAAGLLAQMLQQGHFGQQGQQGQSPQMMPMAGMLAQQAQQGGGLSPGMMGGVASMLAQGLMGEEGGGGGAAKDMMKARMEHPMAMGILPGMIKDKGKGPAGMMAGGFAPGLLAGLFN